MSDVSKLTAALDDPLWRLSNLYKIITKADDDDEADDDDDRRDPVAELAHGDRFRMTPGQEGRGGERAAAQAA